MTERAVTAAAAQRTLLLLTATRWFPVGLIIGLVTLLMLERGLSISQVAIAIATQGIVMLALELPTGGLADALGRRPVLIAAGVIAIVAAVVFVLAPSLRRSSSWPGPCRASSARWTPVRWRPGTSTPPTRSTPVRRWSRRWPGPVPCSAWPSPSVPSAPVAWSPGPPSTGPAPLLLPFGLAIAVNLVHLVLTRRPGAGGPSGGPGVALAPGRRLGAFGAANGRRRRRPAAHRSGAAQRGAGRGLLGRGDDRLRDLQPGSAGRAGRRRRSGPA